jgi:hypothetical protein
VKTRALLDSNFKQPNIYVVPAKAGTTCGGCILLTAVYPRRRVSSTLRLLGSITDASEYWIARSSRAMTAEEISNSHTSAIPPHVCASFILLVPALSKKEGAGKTGCALHPRSRVQKCETKTHTSIQVQRRHSGLPCAVVYGLFRALPGDRAFLPPSPPRSLLLKNLTPASGRQDHTASPSALAPFVFRHRRVHRIPHQRP